MSKFAWVTLTTNDTYSLGALVLANSLKRVGTAHQLAVLVTPNVSETMKSKLKDAFNVVQEVDVLDSKDEANLALLARPELGITFTKLHCWRLVQFEKCVFLDADILVLQNSDELFEREELSAAPDVSWPDCFNSGVFVYRPNLETFNKLIEFAVKNGSFDGGDQGLLNQYFSDWATKDISKHLPFTYNTAAYAAYCYLPAFKQFRDRIKILHFAGKLKPWLATFDSQNKRAHTPQGYEHAAEFIQLWWNIFCDNVHQSLHNSMIYSTSGRIYQEHSFPIIVSETIMNQNPIVFHDPWEDYYEKLEKCNIYEKNLYESNSFNEKIIQNNLNTNNNNNNNNNNDNINETETKIDIINNEHQNNNNNILLDCYTIENTNLETFEDNINLQNDNNSDNNNNNNSDINFSNNNYKQNSNDNFNKIEEISKNISTPPPSPPPSYSQSIQKQHQYETQLQLETQKNNNESISSKITSESINLNNKQNFNNNDNDNRLNNNKNVNNNNIKNNNDCNIEVNYNNNNNNKNNYYTNDNSSKIENTKDYEESGLAGVLSTLRLGEAKTPEQEAYEQAMRRQCWESGNIDYTGKDSFDNIWKKISQTIDSKPKSDKQESASM